MIGHEQVRLLQLESERLLPQLEIGDLLREELALVRKLNIVTLLAERSQCIGCISELLLIDRKLRFDEILLYGLGRTGDRTEHLVVALDQGIGEVSSKVGILIGHRDTDYIGILHSRYRGPFRDISSNCPFGVE